MARSLYAIHSEGFSPALYDLGSRAFYQGVLFSDRPDNLENACDLDSWQRGWLCAALDEMAIERAAAQRAGVPVIAD